MSVEIALALGSNLGDRKHFLEQAVALLGMKLQIIAVSPWLETTPVNCPAGSGNYLNGALLALTNLPPEEILALLLGIEQQLGRRRQPGDVCNAPRVIDLDLLFYGNRIINQPPRLIVPHPRLHQRFFVLRPLLDIAPNFVHPQTGLTVRALYDQLEITNEPKEN